MDLTDEVLGSQMGTAREPAYRSFPQETLRRSGASPVRRRSPFGFFGFRLDDGPDLFPVVRDLVHTVINTGSVNER